MAISRCFPAAEFLGPPLISQPTPEPDGRIPTLNEDGGFMTQHLRGPSTDFVNFCSSALTHPVFDGGCAYGVTALPALARGATVIANDIESGHLKYIAQNAGDLVSRLFLREDPLPSSLEFARDSLAGIHLCRVLHFLSGDDVATVFDKSFKVLIPGGRLFVTIASQFHRSCSGRENEYETRYRAGEKFPGVFWMRWLRRGAGEPAVRLLHVIDPRVMVRIATESGFVVKKVELVGQDGDGIEYTGAVLVKPPLF
jgi:SAM-dependent methyltransferase